MRVKLTLLRKKKNCLENSMKDLLNNFIYKKNKSINKMNIF